MERVPEPELMDGHEQAFAYANADFSEPHNRFVEMFKERFPALCGKSLKVLDIGCGAADVMIRFARALPHTTITGIDGAEAMLSLGRQAIAQAGLEGRVSVQRKFLPRDALPPGPFDVVISNAFLHHLWNPAVLWTAVKASGKTNTVVFVVDLFRPPSIETAQEIVDRKASNEPEILRRDFFNSLCAAFRVDEVRAQLKQAKLDALQAAEVSDRHLAVWGVLKNG